MKKILSFVLPLAVFASCAAQDKSDGELRVTLPADYTAPTLAVSHSLIDNMVTAKSEAELKVVNQDVEVKDGVAVLKLDPAGPARYSVDLAPEVRADFYAAPDETIVMDIKSVNPLDYTVTGTPLMDGMSQLAEITEPIEVEFEQVSSKAEVDPAEIQAVYNKYDAAVKEFLANNLNSPAAAFALMDIGGQEFLDAYDALTPEARKSILMPFVELKRPRAIQQAEEERFQKSLESGEVMAPDFTLPDLEGKAVSLSDFRGKWVVIDFWGSWCGWCIKGFPKLKEAYRNAGGRFEVLGVDCRDPESSWRAAVAKYELPWVNVYNAEKEGGVLAAYHVTGFPTKAIVNPEGKLVDITVGEDPSFYTKLNSFINR